MTQIFASLFILCSILHLSTGIKPKEKGNPCTFCRQENVSVVYGPFASVANLGIQMPTNFSYYHPFLFQIASEFNTVTVVTPKVPRQNTAGHILPSAVASWNKKYFPVQHLETQVVIGEKFSFQNIYLEDFAWLQDIVFDANYIHNRTVTTVVFHAPIFEDNLPFFPLLIQKLRRAFPRPEFILGLACDVKAFGQQERQRPTYFSNIIKNHFHHADVVYFFSDFDDLYKSIPINVVVGRVIDLSKKYMLFINIHSNATFSYGMFGVCQDTSDDGVINYPRFVEFWVKFLKMAKAAKLSVIFTEAFDGTGVYKGPSSTIGWWRVQEMRLEKGVSKLAFYTKQEIAKIEANQTNNNLVIQLEETLFFSRNYSAIKFNPYLFSFTPENSQYFDILPTMLNTVSSQFQILIVGNYETFNDSKKIEQIGRLPEFIAQYCSRFKTRFEVEVTLHPKVENTKNILDSIIQANTVFPSLISKVIVLSVLRNATINEIRNELRKTNVTKFVKIGYHFPIVMCAGTSDELTFPEMIEILGPADFVYFTYFPGVTYLTGYYFGVKRLVPQSIELFQKCKDRLAKLIPGIDVAFETGFPDTFKSRTKDYVSLVEFWRELTKWAEQTKTKLVWKEAFDIPYDTNVDNSARGFGWWIVKEDENNESSVIIEEKRLVALKNIQESFRLVPEEEPVNIVSLITTVSVFVVVSIIFSVVFLKFKSQRKRKAPVAKYAKAVDVDEESVAVVKRTVFVLDQSTVIGTGHFGIVYKSYIPEFQGDVAVKLPLRNTIDNLHASAAVESILSEIKIMSTTGQHENILRLLGVCLDEDLFLITEYCSNGSLLSYLRVLSVEKRIPSNYELLNFCSDIATGMEYLHTKHVIHGDLSARNVLLNENFIGKISDFGLSRKLDGYEKFKMTGEQLLPWRWMALESLRRFEFSSKSDVWSMGVTFWEIFTLGHMPYPEITYDESFCEKLAEGLRLPQPTLATNNLYRVMYSCWRIDSEDRPNTREIMESISTLKANEYVSV